MGLLSDLHLAAVSFRYPVHYALKQQLSLSDLLSAETLNRQAEELSTVYKLVQSAFDAGLFKAISIEYFTNLILAELDATVRYTLTHDRRDWCVAAQASRKRPRHRCWQATLLLCWM